MAHVIMDYVVFRGRIIDDNGKERPLRKVLVHTATMEPGDTYVAKYTLDAIEGPKKKSKR